MLLFIISSILFFIISAFIAERSAPEEYNQRLNTIDELGCQTYELKKYMQWGFIGLGIILIAGILINFNETIEELHYSIPLFMYAVFSIFAGVYSSKPFEHLVFYSIKEHKLHALFLQFSGLSLALLIVMKLIMVPGIIHRSINLVVLIFSLYTSAQSNRHIPSRGIYQRVMFLGHFLWLMYAYSSFGNGS